MSYQNCSYFYYNKKRIKRGSFFAIVYWTTTVLLILSCVILKYHRTFSLTNMKSVIFWYFWTQRFRSSQRNPCPGPEFGVFFIDVVDLSSISVLVIYSIFSASKYNYNNSPLKFEFFKWKMIHSRLFLIVILQSILLRCFIKKIHMFIITRNNSRGTFYNFFQWPIMVFLFFAVF